MFQPLPGWLLTLVLVVVGVAADVGSAVASEPATQTNSLERQRSDLDGLRKLVQSRVDSLADMEVTEHVLEQARLDVEAARVELESVQLDQQSVLAAQQAAESELHRLEEQQLSLKSSESPPQETLVLLQDQIADSRASVANLAAGLAELQQKEALVRDRLALNRRWLNSVENEYEIRQEASRREALDDARTRLQKEQARLYSRADELRSRLDAVSAEDGGADQRRRSLSVQIEAAEEQAKLMDLEMKLAAVQNDLAAAEDVLITPDVDVARLKAALADLKRAAGDLAAQRQLIERKLNVYSQQLAVIEKRESSSPGGRTARDERNAVSALIKELESMSRSLATAEERLSTTQQSLTQLHERQIREGLFVSRDLPESAAAWVELGRDLAQMPMVVGKALGSSLAVWGNALADAGAGRLLVLIVGALTWSGLVIGWRSQLAPNLSAVVSRDEPNFAAASVKGLVELLHRNAISIGLVVLLAMFLWVPEVPEADRMLLVSAALIAVACKTLVNLAWRHMVAPEVPEERRQPNLYRQIRFTLVGGGVFTFIVVVAHLVPVSNSVQDFVDRTYMLFVLGVTLPALGIRNLFVQGLDTRFGEQRWAHLLQLLTFVVPASITIGALVGLIGYVNLAWSIGAHLGWLLVVLVLWYLSNGYMGDFVVLVKNFANAHSKNGLLWTQDVINPLHKLARALLAVGAVVVLFAIYGWDADSPAIRLPMRVLEARLFSLGEAEVSTLDIMALIAGLTVLVWFSKWIRQITFRWLYYGIVDLGIRHSLAVLTQYAIVLVGVLVILRLIGIDLTALAIFAGAMGVGIGLGLQSLANNFISGLLLLLERPLRTGDIVKIENHEGEITRIGMRSVTVRTWDNQEVIVPNADFTSVPFINWTHSDNVVRTVLPIGISYSDDPHRAQKIILDVLQGHPEVVAEPAPRAWLSQFGDSSVMFHVQYFIHVQKSGLLQVKSEVLMAIWDAFKKEGIHIPFPQRDLHIKEMPQALQNALQDTDMTAEQRFGRA